MNGRPVRWTRSSFLASCAVLLLAASSGCDSGPDSPDQATGRQDTLNLLLITLDTARADHFGCYGSTEVLTPNMDRLAQESAQFMNATAVAPLTLPSHASLLTGTYPFHHGVRDNLGFELPEESHTLAEILRAEGWRTGGFVSAYVLHSNFGMAQGFEEYSDTFDFETGLSISAVNVQRDGSDTLKDAFRWLEQNSGRPFFCWIHLFDPHTPYEAPQPFASRYPDDPYAAEVAYTDSLLGEILAELDRLDRRDVTVIAVLGDHGEGRGDHKETFHGLFVYDETIQVPFLIKAPGYAPKRIEAQVRLIDLMPTLLALLGVDPPPSLAQDPLAGRSLLPLLTGERSDLKLAAYSETHYPSLHYGWSPLRSLRAGPYKYIEAPRPELYDLAADPKERNNLYGERREIAEKLQASLKEIERRAGAGKMSRKRDSGDDARNAEALRVLGYTGSADRSIKEGATLPDPKDKVDVLNALESAQRLISAGRRREALPHLRWVIEAEPEMADALLTYAVALFQLEDYAQAVQVLEKTLELAPELFAAQMNLAFSLEKLGRREEAIKAYGRALELDPGHGEAMERLVDLHFNMRQFKQTIELCRRYLKQHPDRLRIRTLLAISLLNLGRIQKAEAEIEQAMALDPFFQNLQYLRGKIRQIRRDYAKAADAYEAELSRYKDNLDAYQSLAAVCEPLKDWNRTIRWLEEGVRQFPGDFTCHLMLARAYAEKGDARESALNAARRALELNPASQEAKRILEILQKTNDRAR